MGRQWALVGVEPTSAGTKHVCKQEKAMSLADVPYSYSGYLQTHVLGTQGKAGTYPSLHLGPLKIQN